MARRQEEKERRRREREAAERRAQSQSARARRLQIVGGAVLGVAVIAVAIILVVAGGGPSHGTGGDATASAASSVKLPAPRITNLDEAARVAGCTVKSPPIEGRDHTTGPVRYKTNPPTSGEHNPQPAADGVYDPGHTPAPEHYVHSLEHGRIELQYRPGAPRKTIDTLVALFNEPVDGSPGYHALVFENNTGMPAAVAATAWGQMITCPRLDDAAIDALRAFRARYTDQGPEFIP